MYASLFLYTCSLRTLGFTPLVIACGVFVRFVGFGCWVLALEDVAPWYVEYVGLLDW